MTRCEQCKNGKLPNRILLDKMTVFTTPPDWQIIPHCGYCGVWLSKTSRRKIDHLMTKIVEYKIGVDQ